MGMHCFFFASLHFLRCMTWFYFSPRSSCQMSAESTDETIFSWLFASASRLVQFSFFFQHICTTIEFSGGCTNCTITHWSLLLLLLRGNSIFFTLTWPSTWPHAALKTVSVLWLSHSSFMRLYYLTQCPYWMLRSYFMPSDSTLSIDPQKFVCRHHLPHCASTPLHRTLSLMPSHISLANLQNIYFTLRSLCQNWACFLAFLTPSSNAPLLLLLLLPPHTKPHSFQDRHTGYLHRNKNSPQSTDPRKMWKFSRRRPSFKFSSH